MRTAISELDFRRARTVDDALAMVADGRTPVAGATDVFVALNVGTLRERAFVDIWALRELRDITATGDTLVIGALATYTDAIRSPVVAGWLPMLIEASRQVGGPQIQNRAAVGATIVLRSSNEERRVAFNEFYTGYRATAMRPGELIVAIEVPRVDGRQWFRKVGTRAAQAISKVVAAGVRGDEPRFALGSVGATTVRVPSAEKALRSDDIAGAAAALSAGITPIDDVRSTADYRRRVAVNLLRRFWSDTAD